MPLQTDSPHEHVVPRSMILESSDVEFTFSHTLQNFLATHTLARDTSIISVLNHFTEPDLCQAQQGHPLVDCRKPGPLAVVSVRTVDGK